MEQTFSSERGHNMTDIDRIKTLIVEAVTASQDADLLDLVLKLLISDGG